MIRILTKRIQAKTGAIERLGDDQFGFIKVLGTRDTIGALRVLTERSIQNGQDVYICFVDYEKAFDRVEWRRLAATCTETNGNRLERQKTNRKPVHGTANASKNRWRVLRTGEGGQRCETGMPAFATTI